ncbi:hypothetical protein E2557_04010 [Staphylococcus petrasii]|uniref:Uncharacterized protein n=1 Tax=Staphylococcus petrasii TaxID=1276936 RepID=A0ABY2KWP7_9STAP|nr:hypothetical protein E2557_04010 [Staphylococcus petrasii]TGE17473.1 hypothetical protein BJR09_06660 [Staphylococcus petrasii]
MKTPRGAVLVEDYRLRQHPRKATQLKRVNIYLRTSTTNLKIKTAGKDVFFVDSLIHFHMDMA